VGLSVYIYLYITINRSILVYIQVYLSDALFERRFVPKMEVAAQHALGSMTAWAFWYNHNKISGSVYSCYSCYQYTCRLAPNRFIHISP